MDQTKLVRDSSRCFYKNTARLELSVSATLRAPSGGRSRPIDLRIHGLVLQSIPINWDRNVHKPRGPGTRPRVTGNGTLQTSPV